MNYNISYLVQQYKSGNKEALDEIIKKMNPLIIKYSRLTFPLEYEDAKQEYSLTIIKAVKKMSHCDSDISCLKYLKSAVRNQYINFCSTYYSCPNIMPLEEVIAPSTDIDHLILYTDIQCFLKKFADKKNHKQIFYLYVFEEMSDINIAELLGLSRQYVNRIRKKMIQQLVKENDIA